MDLGFHTPFALGRIKIRREQVKFMFSISGDLINAGYVQEFFYVHIADDWLVKAKMGGDVHITVAKFGTKDEAVLFLRELKTELNDKCRA